MKDRKKSIATLILSIIAIAVMVFLLVVGVGKWHRGKFKNIILGLDLQGGVSITYEAQGDVSADEMKDVLKKMQDRAENFSTESDVYLEGEKRVVVNIPGVDDAEKVLASLGAEGKVEFTDEEGNVLLEGSDVADAKAVSETSQSSSIAETKIKLSFTSSGRTKFTNATAANVNKSISIVYDGEVLSSPNVKEAISSGEAEITGSFSFEEADRIATFIRIGAMPVELKEIRSNVVGAKLGDEAIHTSLLAGVIGLAIILLFMIVMYRILGLAADIALVIYLGLELLLLNGLNITLTLPGVAGIILSIGMAVDANVIIFTRIKEEIALGKDVASSIKLGFEKASSAIIDGNITTLIAAAVLALKGSGTVKGFAYTLAIGIIVSMFTALFVTRNLVEMLYSFGAKNQMLYGLQKDTKTINFVKHRMKYFIISGILIVAGFVGMGINMSKVDGLFSYGLDFKGGTSLVVDFNDDAQLPSNKDVKELFNDKLSVDADVTTANDAKEMVIRSSELSETQRDEASALLKETYDVEEVTYESISATVSNEMRADAVVAVLLATVAMLIYIWVRFKNLSTGLSAVIALVHDVLVVMGVYALTRIEVGNTFIACMLTIVGYSINDTIVVFDRIRENRNRMTGKDTMEDVLNRSISQTITRSIYTSLTTFVMVLVMYILGVDSIKDFTLPMMAGVICGTYSSICVAGMVWYQISGKKVKAATAKKGRYNKPEKNSDGAVV